VVAAQRPALRPVAAGVGDARASRPIADPGPVPVSGTGQGPGAAAPTEADQRTERPRVPAPRGLFRPRQPPFGSETAAPPRRWLWVGSAVFVVVLLVIGLTLYRTERTGRTTATPRLSVAATPALRATRTVRPAVAVPSIGTPVKLASAPNYVAAAPNGHQLYIADGNQTVSVLDTSDNRVTTNDIRMPGPAQFLSFSPDGRYVYVSLWDRKGGDVHAVSILDTSDNTIKKTIPVRTRPFLAAVTPDGGWLYVPNHDTHTVSVIDTKRMVQAGEITVPPEPHYVSFSADGKRAYVADHESNVITVVDTATRRPITNIKVGKSPHSVEQNPVRPLVINVNWDDGTVSAIDTKTNSVRGTVGVGKLPLNIHWSPDGRYAYVVNSGSNNLSVIRADTLTVTATLPTGTYPTSIAVLPDGTRGYISNSKDNSLTVLNLSG
jgi:YVTN family beta-propeller protein